jgi:hypothetical protein
MSAAVSVSLSGDRATELALGFHLPHSGCRSSSSGRAAAITSRAMSADESSR